MWTELSPFLVDFGMPGLMAAMVLFGWLIPRRTHERELANRDAQIVRLTTALDKAEAQRDKLMGLADVTVGIVRALPSAKDSVS